MIETIFHVLACVALVFYLLEKLIEYFLDYNELKSAYKIKKLLDKKKK